jgi:plasmid stabilization system protein ParE
MPRVRWTLQARQELKEIAKYIARRQHRPRAAAKLVDDIGDKLMLQLSRFAEAPVMSRQ